MKRLRKLNHTLWSSEKKVLLRIYQLIYPAPLVNQSFLGIGLGRCGIRLSTGAFNIQPYVGSRFLSLHFRRLKLDSKLYTTGYQTLHFTRTFQLPVTCQTTYQQDIKNKQILTMCSCK